MVTKTLSTASFQVWPSPYHNNSHSLHLNILLLCSPIQDFTSDTLLTFSAQVIIAKVYQVVQ
jgi:hypothetical protein